MKLRSRTVTELADMICGNEPAAKHFIYRTMRGLEDFFRKDCGVSTNNGDIWGGVFGGNSRRAWAECILDQIAAQSWPDGNPPDQFARAIAVLMDQEDAKDEPAERPAALAQLNRALKRENLEAFYAADEMCYLRRIGSTGALPVASPHRPFTSAETAKRTRLARYLDTASEDELIENVLVALFRQIGFHRITSAGHKDKALEYGKDIWMRYQLPTQHFLYFGIQVKKDKIDSSGRTKPGNPNIAEVLNQAQMMLAHEIFDPEVGRTVLVDHAFIVAGGEITKAARSFIGRALDNAKRSQIMFIDREDILNLYVVNNLPLPDKAQ